MLIPLAAFELLKFEKWPQVVLRNPNFDEESSPVLSYSTARIITEVRMKACALISVYSMHLLRPDFLFTPFALQPVI